MNRMSDLISRKAAIDVLSVEKEILSRVLDDMDVVGAEREKYSWGLELIESYINDIEELPPEPDWEEMLVICDNCGHAIRVKRLERRTDEAN